MKRILMITPYRFKGIVNFETLIYKKSNEGYVVDTDTRQDIVWDGYYFDRKVTMNNEDLILYYAQALPDDILRMVHDINYDVAYIDKEYNAEEVMLIRNQLIGTESRPIIYF